MWIHANLQLLNKVNSTWISNGNNSKLKLACHFWIAIWLSINQLDWKRVQVVSSCMFRSVINKWDTPKRKPTNIQ